MIEKEKNTKTDAAEEGVAAETAETTGAEEERTGVLVFKTPYVWERQEYKELDLSGIEKLTVKDAMDVQERLFDQRDAAAMTVTETATSFYRGIASKGTGLPIEFFNFMPRKYGRAFQREVLQYMRVNKSIEKHVMEFENPYVFEGETYTAIDLSNIANMTSLNESEAENRLARKGVTAADQSVSYQYAVIIASMATGKPEEFFTGLPIREVMKLRVAVNDPDFFE